MSLGSEDASVTAAAPQVLHMNGEEVKCDLSWAATGSEVYEALAGELTSSSTLVVLREEGEVLPRSATATLYPGEVLTLVVRSVFSVRAMLLQERDDLMSQMKTLQVSMEALHANLQDIDGRTQRTIREECILISSASLGVLSQQEVRILLQSITDPHELLEDMCLAARSTFEFRYQSAKFEAECKPTKSEAWCQVASFPSCVRLDSQQVPSISSVTAARQFAALDVNLLSSACKTDWWLRVLRVWRGLQDHRCQKEQCSTELRQLHEELVAVAARLTELLHLWNDTLRDACKVRNADGSLIQDVEQLEDAMRRDPLDDELGLLRFIDKEYLTWYEYWYGLQQMVVAGRLEYFDVDGNWDRAYDGDDDCLNWYQYDMPASGDCPEVEPLTWTEDTWADKHDFRKWSGQRTRLVSTIPAKKDEASFKNAAGHRQAVKQGKLSKKRGGRFKPGEHALFVGIRSDPCGH